MAHYANGVSKTELRVQFGELLKGRLMGCPSCREEMYNFLVDLMMMDGGHIENKETEAPTLKWIGRD